MRHKGQNIPWPPIHQKVQLAKGWLAEMETRFGPCLKAMREAQTDDERFAAMLMAPVNLGAKDAALVLQLMEAASPEFCIRLICTEREEGTLSSLLSQF